MAFEDIESSIQESELLELYKFTEKESGLVWGFSSATEVITYDGEFYVPEGITREKVGAEAAEPFKAKMKITTSRSNSFASRFISGIADSETSVEVFKRHIPTGEQITFWSGEVLSVKIDKTKADIYCAPINLDLPRRMMHRKYQKQCAYALYSADGCKVDKSLFKSEGTVTAINGAVYTCQMDIPSGTPPSNHFTGGFLQIGTEKKMITAHEQDADPTISIITLLTPMVNALVSQDFIAYAGCQHNQADCFSKFNNIDNYGGQPYIPSKNVFDGAGISY